MIVVPKGLKILEQTSLPRILVYLTNKRRASRTDLKRDIGASQQAIYNALPMLMKKGLIEEIESTTFPYKKEIELTKKGYSVADQLLKINELLGDSEDLFAKFEVNHQKR